MDGGLVAGGRRAVLIAGPTASGKSALALQRARELGGVVVNTDALQVYAGLRVLTARPSDAEMGNIPHRLYGTVTPEQRFSTGDWARAVLEVISASGDVPLIFAGGTGLYFEVLTRGFTDVPPVSPVAIAWAEEQIRGLDAAGRENVLLRVDPLMADRLQAPDPQRVTRALAVWRETGRSLATFQDVPQRGLLEGWSLEKIVLNPGRDLLRARIEQRFRLMFSNGAVDETKEMFARKLDPSLPAMKAIGLREIGEWLGGEITEQEAIRRSVIATQQYAKRQRTWFRGRMSDWTWIEPQLEG